MAGRPLLCPLPGWCCPQTREPRARLLDPPRGKLGRPIAPLRRPSPSRKPRCVPCPSCDPSTPANWLGAALLRRFRLRREPPTRPRCPTSRFTLTRSIPMRRPTMARRDSLRRPHLPADQGAIRRGNRLLIVPILALAILALAILVNVPGAGGWRSRWWGWC